MKTQTIKVKINKHGNMMPSYDISVKVDDDVEWVKDEVNDSQNRHAIKAYRSAGIHLTEAKDPVTNKTVLKVKPTDITKYLEEHIVDKYQHKILCDLSGIKLDLEYRVRGKLVKHLRV